MGRQATDWKKVSANNAFDKGLASKIYKKFFRLNNKKMNNQFKRNIADLKPTSPQKIYYSGKQTHE